MEGHGVYQDGGQWRRQRLRLGNPGLLGCKGMASTGMRASGVGKRALRLGNPGLPGWTGMASTGMEANGNPGLPGWKGIASTGMGASGVGKRHCALVTQGCLDGQAWRLPGWMQVVWAKGIAPW